MIRDKKKSSSRNNGVGIHISDEDGYLKTISVSLGAFLDVLTITYYNQILLEDDV
ncbi:MAG: hypothetical protein ACTSVY_08480 [Candidatus Helarchaeota archaeon]